MNPYDELEANRVLQDLWGSSLCLEWKLRRVQMRGDADGESAHLMESLQSEQAIWLWYDAP